MTITSLESSSTGLRRPLRVPTVQNFHLVWLDENIDEDNNADYHNSITKLREVVNTINTFTDVDECIDFITDVEERATFMIVSETFSKMIDPVFREIDQVNAIYINKEECLSVCLFAMHSVPVIAIASPNFPWHLPRSRGRSRRGCRGNGVK